MVECAQGQDKEELIDRLEIAQLKAKDNDHLAIFLRLVFGHHVVCQLSVELELLEYVQPEFRGDP